MSPNGTFEDLVRRLIREGLDEALAPYLRRLTDPEALTYSVPQAAKVIGTSEPLVRRLIADGHLPTVPHMGGRVLIPRLAVEAHVHAEMP